MAKKDKKNLNQKDLLETIRDENGKIGYLEVPGEILQVWNGKPWESRPNILAMLGGIYVLLFAIFLYLMPDAGFFLLLIPLLLFGSASAHLVNSQYVITDQGIYWRNFMNQIFKRWSEIENFIFEEEMGELFFEKSNMRSRIQRNMPIYYQDNKEEIEQNVKDLHAKAWAEKKAIEDRIRAEVIAELDKESEKEE